MAPAAQASSQQLIVERSARALMRMRSDPEFRALDVYLERAEGVMVFPRVIRAGLVFGGEGGNGVLVARGPGGWSAPAFYTFGGGSAGLQVGYQEAAIVLVFRERKALLDAIDGGLTLGADASVAAGTIGDTGDARAATAASDIVQFVDVGGGLFAGVSLDGAVIAPRDRHNVAYYGSGATPSAILLERRFAAAGAQLLRDALQPRPVQ
jgi:lipid-binding SYLF domain-containing protein